MKLWQPNQAGKNEWELLQQNKYEESDKRMDNNCTDDEDGRWKKERGLVEDQKEMQCTFVLLRVEMSE